MKTTFCLAHFSDLHLCLPHTARRGEFFNKRVLGYLSWRVRRRCEHRPEVAAVLSRELQKCDCDHIAVTGDLTHLALPAEFREAERMLQELGPPSKITVIPGNHDAYVAGNWQQRLSHLENYFASGETRTPDGPQASLTSLFPTLCLRGPCAIIGVSTARPSAPFLAVGSIGRLQLKKLEEILEQTSRRGLFRIVLVHHPPVPGVVRWRKRLVDAAELRSVLARKGAELVLFGHAHRRVLASLEGPGGEIPAICVSSGSSVSADVRRRASYHLYRLSSSPRGWELLLEVHTYSPDGRGFRRQQSMRLSIPKSML